MNSADSPTPRFRRVVLKLSGESFAPAGERGIAMDEVVQIARTDPAGSEARLPDRRRHWRWQHPAWCSVQEQQRRNPGGHSPLHGHVGDCDQRSGTAGRTGVDGCQTRLMTAIRMDGVAEPYIRRRARRHLEKGPHRDSGGRHRQPVRHDRYGRRSAGAGTRGRRRAEGDSSRRRLQRRSGKKPARGALPRIDYNTVLEQNLRVMDHTAITQCMEHDMPMLVFNYKKERQYSASNLWRNGGHLIPAKSKRTNEAVPQQLTNVQSSQRRRIIRTTMLQDRLTNRSGWMMSADEILLDAEERMEKAVDVLKKNLAGIRTGRANPGLVDSLRVEVYGSPTPIKQWPQSVLRSRRRLSFAPMIRARSRISKKRSSRSDLGFNPQNDGRVIRINIPPLPAKCAKKMVSRIKELAEEAKVAIRNIRRDANKAADQAEKDKTISEDVRDDAQGSGPRADEEIRI